MLSLVIGGLLILVAAILCEIWLEVGRPMPRAQCPACGAPVTFEPMTGFLAPSLAKLGIYAQTAAVKAICPNGCTVEWGDAQRPTA